MYTALTPEIVASAEADFLLDTPVPDAPMIIVFTGNQPGVQPPNFEFYMRLLELEKRYGTRLNKLLLRDRKYAYYRDGVPGLGDDIQKTAQTIKGFLKEIHPRRVICLGNSMGGYLAIVFGYLLQANRVIALNPASTTSQKFASTFHDYRFIESFKRVAESNVGSPGTELEFAL